MPKPPPHRPPDPMAGVVDRLLAQLPGLQNQPEPPRSSGPRAPVQPTWIGPQLHTPAIDHSLIGTWARVLLALSLGVMMAGWPYLRTCGLPLLGYLSAVGIVVLAGGWAAVASWRTRIALAHAVSLALLLYGILLVMAELLPRTCYAVKQATWQCEASAPALSWTAII